MGLHLGRVRDAHVGAVRRHGASADVEEKAAALEGREAKPKDDKPKAEASMFYAAYFKEGAPSAGRPVTFEVQLIGVL